MPNLKCNVGQDASNRSTGRPRAWPKIPEAETSPFIFSALGFLLVATLVAVAYAILRGPWIDEFFQMWFTDSAVGHRQLLIRTIEDTHTPYFNVGSWVWGRVVPAKISALRMINLIPLGLLISVWFCFIRRYPADRLFLSVFLILLSSSTYFRLFFAEYRMYFLMFCLGAILALSLFFFYRGSENLGKESRVTRWILAGALVLLINIHYFGTVFCSVLTAWAALLLGLERRWSDVRFLVTTAVAALLPLAGWLVLQFTAVGRIPIDKVSWITTTSSEALRVIGNVIVHGPGFNIFAFVAAGLILIAGSTKLAKHETRYGLKTWLREMYAGSLRSAALFGFPVVTFLGLMFAVNLVHPIVQERYLICVVGAVSLILADLSSRLLIRHRWLFWGLLANGVLYSGLRITSDTAPAKFARWNATAEIVEREVRKSPNTPVILFEVTSRQPQASAPNRWSAMYLGYEFLAGHKGFLQNLQPLSDRTVVHSETTIFWGEHLPARLLQTIPNAARFVKQAGLSIPTTEPMDLSVEPGTSGAVLFLRTASDPHRSNL